MNEIVNYMVQKFGISPKDAMSMWNMMVIDGKKKGVDMNKLPAKEVIRFIDMFLKESNK